MNAAGYVLTGMRKHRRRAHSPHILAHSLTTAFFGVDELAGWFPDYDTFDTWPATARLLAKLRRLDRHELAGRSSLEHFGHWWNPETRRVILCSRREARKSNYTNVGFPKSLNRDMLANHLRRISP